MVLGAVLGAVPGAAPRSVQLRGREAAGRLRACTGVRTSVLRTQEE